MVNEVKVVNGAAQKKVVKPRSKWFVVAVCAGVVALGVLGWFVVKEILMAVADRDDFYSLLCFGDEVAVDIEESSKGKLMSYKCGKAPVCTGGEVLAYHGGVVGGEPAFIGTLVCYGWRSVDDGRGFPTCNGENCGIYKPVIYLYPQQEMEIKVGLDYDGELVATYPEIGSGWQVWARPDGTLRDIQSGLEYSYLFWEGQYSVTPKYDWSKGFIVRGSEVREFLQEKLAEMGLTPKEYNEFIVYWYPLMQDNEWNLVHFANDEEYGKYARLDITPKPDSMLRVFMVFRGIDAPVAVEPQVFERFERTGFSVVEWGGSGDDGSRR